MNSMSLLLEAFRRTLFYLVLDVLSYDLRCLLM
jgi:hypothetical protein